MIYEEMLEERKLKHMREDLLELIAKLKKSHRAKIILLNNKIRSLNRIGEKICDAPINKVEEYFIKLKGIKDLTTPQQLEKYIKSIDLEKEGDV